ncbi:hypothetical protein E4T48_04771 [Aureobasidium sp. EXF-10727]|nr:hypothetical protein E4T48_04771 [Aureobasidium sp. EXF-10727]
MTAATSRRGHTSSTAYKKHDQISEAKKDKKEKKYVTTNAIFKSKSDRVSKRAKPSSKGKRSDLGKSRRRREPSSSPPPKKRYTLADESNEVLNSYRSHVADDSEQMIARAYKDLIQQLDKTTLGPDALSSRIAQAIEAAQDICSPIADEFVTVGFRDDVGNVVSRQRVPIGLTVKRFEEDLEKTKTNLEALWEEWEDNRREIAELGAQILHDPKFPSQFGLEDMTGLFSPLSYTNPEVESLRRLFQRENDKAHKELDQEAKDSINKHKELQTLWVSWLNDQLN